MELVTITVEEFKKLMNNEVSQLREDLDKINKKIPANNSWLTIEEACKLLKISRRTMQTYRDEGLLGYSKVQGRVFIRLSDIEKMLNKYYIESDKCNE